MSAVPPSECLSVDRLETYLAHGAADDAIQAHLDACGACRALLEEVRENNALMERLVEAERTRGDAAPGSPAMTRPLIEGLDIRGEIHRGGQGIIYRAVQTATRRTVAVKVMLQGALATSRQRRRFEREAELVATLRHPNIVTVHDSGVTSDGLLFFVMEHVDGRPLDEYVSRNAGVASTEAVLRLFARICDAVSYAHQHGVIHRDLKPSNILVDADGEPHVLDFGVAKAIGGPGEGQSVAVRTLAGEFMGTLAYAAPEQVSGDPAAVDVRTDVYALGVILYELVGGRHPFAEAKSTPDLIRAVAGEDPSPPSTALPPGGLARGSLRTELRGRGNREIDAIVLKALAKGPDRRYQSADHLRREIENHLAGRPIDARRDSAWYVLGKIVRRHKLPVAIVVAFVLLVVGFAGTVSVLYQRALRETARVQQMKAFLEDMLGSAEAARFGQEVTVRDTLDEAARWVETGLRGQKELKSSVHLTIGNTYRNLGLYDQAEPHLKTALALRRECFGDVHPDVAESLNGLALLHNARGDPTEAEKLAREALEMQRRLFGPDALPVAMTLNNLAYIQRDAGDYPAAERSYRQALTIRRARLDQGHPDVALLLFKLAMLESRRGDPQSAERLHRQALEIRRAALPSRHPDVVRSLLRLGELLSRRGEAGQAEALIAEAVAIRRANLPAGHWKVAEATSVLGACRVALGEYEAAESLLLDSYAVLRTVRGEQDEKSAEALRRIVRLYEAWQRPEEAARYRASLPPRAR